MDMEDAPPTSDADVCISVTPSSSRMASATVSGGKLFFYHFHTFLSPCMSHVNVLSVNKQQNEALSLFLLSKIYTVAQHDNL